MSEQEQKQPESYEDVRPFLKAAFEQILAAGRGVREMAEFTLERLGDTALPYVNRFLAEVHAGQVKIQGLTASIHRGLFDGRPSPEERERMIREAAYLLAEQRGFAGGSPEDDWAEAERQVDARLAEQEGLIARGRHAIESAAGAAGHGAEATYALVQQWLMGREPTTDGPQALLTHAPESTPPVQTDTPAAEKPEPAEPSSAAPSPIPKSASAKADTRRAGSRGRKDGESATVVKATGTRTRKPRSPKAPPVS